MGLHEWLRCCGVKVDQTFVSDGEFVNTLLLTTCASGSTWTIANDAFRGMSRDGTDCKSSCTDCEKLCFDKFKQNVSKNIVKKISKANENLVCNYVYQVNGAVQGFQAVKLIASCGDLKIEAKMCQQKFSKKRRFQINIPSVIIPSKLFSLHTSHGNSLEIHQTLVSSGNRWIKASSATVSVFPAAGWYIKNFRMRGWNIDSNSWYTSSSSHESCVRALRLFSAIDVHIQKEIKSLAFLSAAGARANTFNSVVLLGWRVD